VVESDRGCNIGFSGNGFMFIVCSATLIRGGPRSEEVCKTSRSVDNLSVGLDWARMHTVVRAISNQPSSQVGGL
jgi:hypothetical protein